MLTGVTIGDKYLNSNADSKGKAISEKWLQHLPGNTVSEGLLQLHHNQGIPVLLTVDSHDNFIRMAAPLKMLQALP